MLCVKKAFVSFPERAAVHQIENGIIWTQWKWKRKERWKYNLSSCNHWDFTGVASALVEVAKFVNKENLNTCMKLGYPLA